MPSKQRDPFCRKFVSKPLKAPENAVAMVASDSHCRSVSECHCGAVFMMEGKLNVVHREYLRWSAIHDKHRAR